MNIRLLIGVLLFIISHCISAQNINIGIYNSVKSQSLTFVAKSGKYDIVCNNKIPYSIKEGDSVTVVKFKNSKFKVYNSQGKSIGKFRNILFRGKKQSNYFAIHFNDTLSNVTRLYDNDLNVILKEEYFQLINDVNFEKYIAGVVEAEGPNAPLEYFKTQAILCRTYAMKHYEKHLNQGFNLCDDVHCQAYKGRCKYNPQILEAAIKTEGLVIVDEKLEIISATFYANSGGETVNSEDVWVSALPYLRAVPDKYSLNQYGYKWTKEISVEDWKNYLIKKGLTVPENSDFTFKQDKRKTEYTFNGSKILLKHIRTDWKLRSTFFSIEQKGNLLIFHGKGYGHGVGLSQEGAMEMAKQNFTYDTIIKHYYKGVNIMSIKALNFFQIE